MSSRRRSRGRGTPAAARCRRSGCRPGGGRRTADPPARPSTSITSKLPSGLVRWYSASWALNCIRTNDSRAPAPTRPGTAPPSRRGRRRRPGTPGRRRSTGREHDLPSRQEPDSSRSGPRREDALQGDAEVERQVGLHVVVRQAAAGERDSACGDIGPRLSAGSAAYRSRRCWSCRSTRSGARRVVGRRAVLAAQRVGVVRDLGLEQGDGLDAALLARGTWSDRPGPWPWCIGALPCRSGSAKVLLPSPP